MISRSIAPRDTRDRLIIKRRDAILRNESFLSFLFPFWYTRKTAVVEMRDFQVKLQRYDESRISRERISKIQPR